jgi:enamine deaminase RidA (YjgF/YER057c/UK114 family)
MKKTTINPATLSAPTGYSHVTTVIGGKAIYVSGQVSFDKEGQLVGAGDAPAQARQVYANLKAALAAGGATLKDVVKLNTYVVNINPDNIAAIRAARREYMGEGPYPSSTLVGVTGLVNPELLFEVEAIAVVPDRAGSAPAKKKSAKKASTKKAAKGRKKAR